MTREGGGEEFFARYDSVSVVCIYGGCTLLDENRWENMTNLKFIYLLQGPLSLVQYCTI